MKYLMQPAPNHKANVLISLELYALFVNAEIFFEESMIVVTSLHVNSILSTSQMSA